MQTSKEQAVAPRPVLEFSSVRVVFSGRGEPLLAVEDVSFAVNRGEILALMGPSGCGKTTLLRLAAGLQRPTAGMVTFCGREITGPGRQRGIMFQEPRLFPWLTVSDNVALGMAEGTEVEKVEARIDELLTLMGVADFADHYPWQLSGGMAQRVALARVLAMEPEVLLLDEPFSGLDIANRVMLQDALGEIVRRRALSVVMVTHSVDEALYLADRVYVLSPRPGRIRHCLPVPLPRPRDRVDAALHPYRAQITQWLVDGARHLDD